MPYIQPQDYAAYGIPAATAAQVAAASGLIDAQIGRPEGLLWSPDANGMPAWMAGKTATRTYKLTSAIIPGDSVILTLPFGQYGPGDIGSAVVLDRSNAEAAETCVITAATGNTITLDAVQFPHDINATVEFGLEISEECRIAHDGMARTSARPLARLLSVTGSYRSGLRGQYRPMNYAEALLSIGSTQPWNPFPVSQCDIDEITGICWLLPGDVRSGYARVKLSYIAGWSYDTLPDAIKQATASVVQAIGGSDASYGNWKVLKDGDATIERFAATAIDAGTMSLLAPYRNIRI